MRTVVVLNFSLLKPNGWHYQICTLKNSIQRKSVQEKMGRTVIEGRHLCKVGVFKGPTGTSSNLDNNSQLLCRLRLFTTEH